MALPLLESLPAFGAAASPFPKRFGVMFMGCGINEDHWSATGDGAEMKLSKTLSVLEPLKHKINVVDGLFNKASVGQGIHPAQTGSLLSGAQMSKGAILHSGMSVDQMIANTIGQDTAQSSIVLACDPPMTGYHETNYSMAYSSHVSWQSPDSPLPVELYPSAGVRQPLRESRQSAEYEHHRSREGQRGGDEPEGQFRGQDQAGRISDQRARSGETCRQTAPRQGCGRGQSQTDRDAA